MRTIAKWGLGVVAGGLALGLWLGHATRPEIKAPAPPARFWQPDDSAAAGPPPAFAEPAPPFLAGGYRPDLDYDAEAWELPIPAEDLAPLYPAPDSDGSGPYPGADPAYAAGGPLEAENAARAAEAAAEAAAAAAGAPSAPPADPAAVRKSDLARSGLY